MDEFEFANSVYRDGRLLLEASRERAVLHDELRWAREDLEEALLDLKPAVMDLDRTSCVLYAHEAIALIAHVRAISKRS